LIIVEKSKVIRMNVSKLPITRHLDGGHADLLPGRHPAHSAQSNKMELQLMKEIIETGKVIPVIFE